MEEKDNKFNFKKFFKKSWFYIGIFIIVIGAVIILMSDEETKLSGDVYYDEPMFYITGNNLYIKERGKDKILISSTMFQDLESRTKEDALSTVLISKGGEYAYFFENVLIDGNSAVGDFYVYYDGKKRIIEKDTGIYFAISDDYRTIVYIKAVYGAEGGSGYENIRYDLYSYNIKSGKKLIESNSEPLWFTVSGDGQSIVYTKYYDAETDTSSLFVYKDGKSTFIDDHMYFYGDYMPKGTFRYNWPFVNYDATKVVYGKRMKYGEMADMYVYSNGKTTLLGEDVLQIFCDETLDTAIIVENYSHEFIVGKMSRIDLNTYSKETIATDVWGLGAVAVAKIVSSEFIALNLYLKNYDEMLNVADMYMATADGEKKVLNAANVSKLMYSKDYSILYGLDYHVDEEGGRLVKIVFGGSESFQKYEFDEFVKEINISDSGNYIAYLQDEDLFYIDEKNKKNYVDKIDIIIFEIMEDDKKIFYLREVGMGQGNIYIKNIGITNSPVMVAEQTHYVWDFGDGNLAFMTGFDFATYTGNVFITDCNGKYELIAENVELPLFVNYIR